jgi:two-component system, chemotaxis family, CheB/CheR fusion protein
VIINIKDAIEHGITEGKQMAEGEIPRPPQSNPEESAPGERSVGAAAALPHPVPIVGVGASAGGLNAFKQLLQHLSIDTGMAFVLIQHLAPEHKSLLTELLAQTTQMPVCEVTDGIEVAPNRVYIIPPNTTMKLVGRGLQLSPRKRTRSGYLPIDLFFESIAAECGRRGIGVVLSGADGDGAVGLSAIAAAGGTTFAQDLPSSQFSEMPEHAAQTGRVDFILPPQEIAAKLNEIGQHFQLEPAVAMTIGPRLPAQQHAIAARQPLNITSADVDPLSHLFELLRKHTGVNFAKYKHATLQRRIQRRMSRHGIARLEDYLTYIQDDAAEIAALYQDFLIDVTSFFRDPEVFQSLKERVFPQLAQQHSQLSPIRIWVPGCATGEEVYSIAICLLEVLDPIVPQPPIQIFATDLNSNAIETARAGIYKRSAMAHVSPERLRRFFVPTGSDYQISKSVRELCVFARHNLCSDPPFSRLDLISCRNVLIYFGATLQKKTIQNLHYGLNPSGFLLLGTAETTNTVTELFTPIAKQHKIYAKRLALALPDLDFPQLGNLTHSSHQDRQTIAPPTTELHLKQIADEIVLQQYAPAGLIVNANLDILEFRGNTSPYLQPAPGKSSLKLMKMVEVGLRTELRTAIHQAKKLSQSIERVVEVNLHNSTESADGSNAVRLAVIPLRVPSSEDSYLLILFETITPQLAPQQQPLAPSQRKVKQTLVELENLRLKQELAALQEQLQMVIDEQEAANQDVRAASEEMLSSNEELQSTNEELETAKEEVQATNEELTTVNEELRSRNQEANQFNNDLLNILSSVQLPILIVGTDLRIGRFTPMAERLFNLIASDVGRSFSNIRHNLNIPDLDLEILRTIDTLTVYQQEIQDRSGRWYHLTIRPYKTQENQIVGATIVLVDVDELKRNEQEIQAARDYAGSIVETVREPLIVLDRDLCVVTANRAFYQMFQLDPPQVEGQAIDTLGNGRLQIPSLRSRLEDLLRSNTSFQDVEVELRFDPTDFKTMRLSGRQILNTGDWQLLLLAIEDITERKQLEAERTILAQVQAARTTAEAANLAKDSFLSMLSHELRNPMSAIVGWSRMLLSGKLNEAQTHRGLEVIDRSATAQNQLLEDLVDLSRITNHKLHLTIEPIDLEPVITNAIETVALAAAAKNIQIEQQLAPLPHQVLGDSHRIEQILWNLLTNAIKFTAPGGQIIVRLSLASTTASAPTASAQIQVIDNGKGISPEFLPYIFDRFRQADNFSTHMENGLGLGLAIVHHLVKLHAGKITATSQLGQGSTFTVQLPLVVNLPAATIVPIGFANAPPAPALMLAGGATIEPEAPSLQGLNILVVDDETDVLTVLATILEHYGATVTTIDSAPAALQTLQAHPQAYDLLLSDLGMPEMDGWELIRRIRALDAPAGGQIPAAALTAYNSSRDRELSRAAGFQAHIAKPIEPEQLVADVANLARKPK